MKNFTRIVFATSLVLMVAFNADSQDVFKSANVGIGTVNPTQKLDVTGNVKFSGALMPNNLPGTAGNILLSGGAGTSPTWLTNGTSGQVLTANASGIPTWTAAGSAISGAWLLTGNSTTPVYGTNFIGFTSIVPYTSAYIEFVSNGTYAGVIDESRSNVLFGRGAGGDSTATSYSLKTGTEVYAIGAGAAESVTTGTLALVAIGYDALHNFTTGAGEGNSLSNNAVGALALYSLTTGIPNNALGTSAGFNITTGTYNVSVGFAANYNQTTGSYNVAAGDSALYGGGEAGGTPATYIASYNTAVGVSALSGIGTGTSGGTGGTGNTAVGYEAAIHTTTGNYNSALGYKSLYSNSTGIYNVGMGYQAGYSNTTGAYNTGIGYRANYSAQTAYGNVAVGSNALYANTYSGNTAVGTGALQNNNAGGPYVSAYVGGANTAVGDSAMYNNVYGVQNVAVGWAALTASGHTSLAAGDTSVGSTAIGYGSMAAMTDGLYNTTLGVFTMNSAPNASYCVAIGFSAMRYNNGAARIAGDIAIGQDALDGTGAGFTGNYDIAIGSGAMQQTSGSASYDIAIGQGAAYSNGALTTGNYDVAIGYYTNVGSTQSYNTAIGYEAAATAGTTVATGSSSLGAGAQATASNATAIGAGATASTANTVILGQTTTATSVGIGTTAPARLLEVAGTANTIRVDGLGAGNSYGNTAPSLSTDQLMYAKGNSGVVGDVYSMPNGTSGNVLTIVGGVPTWSGSSSLTASLPLTITSGNILLSGTSGGVVYGLGSGTGSAFTLAGPVGDVLEGQGPGNEPIWTTIALLAGTGDNWGTQTAVTDSSNDFGTPESTISGNGVTPLKLAADGASVGQVLVWTADGGYGTWKPGSANASLTTATIQNGGVNSAVVVTNGSNQVVNSALGNASIDVQGTAGEVLYGTGSGTSAVFTTGGIAGQVLELTSGVPTWTTLAAGSGWNLLGNSGTLPGTNFIGTLDDNGLYFEVNGHNAGGISALNNNYTGANVYLGGASTSAPILSGAGNSDAGDNNVGLGLSALASVGGGSWQGYGPDNTGVSVMSGNVAVGVYALSSAVYGGGNVALGAWSQRYFNYPTSNTTTGNTAAGAYSLYSNSTGTYNTSIGYKSMYGTGSSTAVGSFNTAEGYNALYNVGAGEYSNTAIGSNALYNTTAGNRNTAVGDSALYSNTTGYYNTAIGYQANVTLGGLTNATVIGYGATASVSNSITLGNSLASSLYLPGYTNTGDILYTSTGTGLVAGLTPGTAGTVLESNGPGSVPIWASVAGVNTVTGTAPIYSTGGANPIVSIQGTNANEYGVLYSAGTGNSAAFTAPGTAGYVLESTGTGAPTWVSPSSSSGWALTGNSGTTPGTNYIGTTDDHGLYFETDGAYAGALDGLNSNYTGANVYLGGASTSSPILPGAGNNDAGDNSVAIGLSALSSIGGPSWTGSGTTSTSVVSGNVAVGVYALSSAVYGNGNTALGAWSQRYFSISTPSTVSGNTAAGAYSLYSNSTGLFNTSVGYQSMYGSGSATAVGNYNSALGYDALYTAGAGMSYNTALGSNSLYNNTGNKNTAVGDSALWTNTTGTNNTAVGYNADVASGGLTNATAIGYEAIAPVNNSITLGNSLVSSLYLPGYATAGDILYTSTAGGGLVAALTPGVSGDVLVSQGPGNAPSWTGVAGVNSVSGAAPIYITGTATDPIVNIQGNSPNTDAGGVLYSTGAGAPAKFTPTPTSAGLILTSTAAGGAPTWAAAPAASGSWLITGNTGTTPGTNFVGTSTGSAENLLFKVNGVVAGCIDQNATSANAYFGYGVGLNGAVTGNGGSGDYGSFNVGMGTGVLANIPNNTTAVTRVAAIGAYAMYNATAGNSNVAIGAYSQYNNTGTYSTAIGAYTLYSNSSGGNETALGYKSMYGSGTVGAMGPQNTAVGYQALYSITTGGANTAVGSNALLNTTAGRNTAVGDSALASNTTGEFNTAVGYQALTTALTTGANYNTALGYNANLSSNSLTYASAIGANAYAAQSNSMVLGAINGVNGATANTNVCIGTNAPASDAALAIKTNHLETVTGSALTENSLGTNTAGTVIGTDVAGVVTFTTSANQSAGAQVTINFAVSYTTAPTVIITPSNPATGPLTNIYQPYVTATTTGFTINFGTAGTAASTSCSFNYFVIESQ